MGLVRNLKSHEILAQLRLGKKITTIINKDKDKDVKQKVKT